MFKRLFYARCRSCQEVTAHIESDNGDEMCAKCHALTKAHGYSIKTEWCEDCKKMVEQILKPSSKRYGPVKFWYCRECGKKALREP